MFKKLLAIFCLTCAMGSISPIMAKEIDYNSHPKAVYAKELVEKAISYYKTVSPEKAYEDFSNHDGQFIHDEFYVITLDEKGHVFSHYNPVLIGRNTWNMRDVKRVLLIQNCIKTAQTKPEGGWVTYHWIPPKTNKLTLKHTFVKKHEDRIFMVGFYVQK